MQFILEIEGNIKNAMRKCGYFFEKQEGTELAFLRPASSSGSGYPRFHIYLKYDSVSRETIFNLHLDQKKPVYEGAAAHAGEYGGQIVEKEAERMKQILK